MRQQIEKNYFLNDLLRKSLLFKKNAVVQGYIDELSKIDSIADFALFRDRVGRLPMTKKHLFSVKRAFGESLLYGHLQAIQQYAGIQNKDIAKFPIMEHGVDFWECCRNFLFPRVCQGDYLSERWFAENPGVPLFSIGPYIHYALPYYDKETFQKKKTEYGKTLLVVPAHTHEMAKQDYDMKKFVCGIMDTYQKDFDTIMVLAYWADISYDLYNLFEQEGACVVSAGFRGDPNFISRLQTIIQFSDMITGNDLGTFVGYGVYYGKPVSLMTSAIHYELLDVDNTSEENALFEKNRTEFYRLFGEQSCSPTDDQVALCEKFWGFSRVKSPEEIRAILNINRNILKRSHGNANKIASAAHQFLESKVITEMERDLLMAALGLK